MLHMARSSCGFGCRISTRSRTLKIYDLSQLLRFNLQHLPRTKGCIFISYWRTRKRAAAPAMFSSRTPDHDLPPRISEDQCFGALMNFLPYRTQIPVMIRLHGHLPYPDLGYMLLLLPQPKNPDCLWLNPSLPLFFKWLFFLFQMAIGNVQTLIINMADRCLSADREAGICAFSHRFPHAVFDSLFAGCLCLGGAHEGEAC